MSRVKNADKYSYELLYIIPNKYTDEEAAPIAKNVEEIITKNGGSIIISEAWEKRRLAYPISGFNRGYYFIVEFRAEGEGLNKINETLRIFKEVIRYQIIKKEIKTAKKLEEEKEVAQKIAAKKEETEKKEKEKDKSKDETKLKLKDLDAKLDRILDTDDLL